VGNQPEDRTGPAAPGAKHVARAADLEPVRRFVAGFAGTAGLVGVRIEQLVLAFSEVATNAIVHGGGVATVTATRTDRAVVIAVHDSGARGEFPSAGSPRPSPAQIGGRGLWLARQMCDEVDIDSAPEGTTVRLTMRLPVDGQGRGAD
jgi:anti-sigma regulatory factor (Ser/Thr protein kinase)